MIDLPKDAFNARVQALIAPLVDEMRKDGITRITIDARTAFADLTILRSVPIPPQTIVVAYDPAPLLRPQEPDF